MSTTSNRRAAFSAPQSNPTTKFLSWKSNDKCFEFYDKVNKVKVPFQLPFKFLALDELHAVKGWSDSCQSGIYSNEVKFISKEILTVKPFKGNEIAKGLYSEIKEKVKSAGAHYVKSIYVMLEDGSLANIQLKGAACQQWGEFTKKNRSRLPDEWVTVANTIEGKKGIVKYYFPIFTFDKSLSESEMDLADEAFGILETYLKAYLLKAEPIANEDVVYEQVDEEDLDF
jgi:hypothetical protein